MSSSKDRKLNYDPVKQLNLLKIQCKSITPTLYKTNSLYLRIVRDSLPKVVRQAIIQLITNNKQNLENLSNSDNREKLKSSIELLVTKCSTLITIEDLINLSLTIDKEVEEDLLEFRKLDLKDFSLLNDDDKSKNESDSNKSISSSVKCSSEPIE